MKVSSRRHGAKREFSSDYSENCSDADVTDPQYVASLTSALQHISAIAQFTISLMVDAAEIESAQCVQDYDPNDRARVWHQSHMATKENIDAALQSAQRAGATGAARRIVEKFSIV